jgi:hypothetical protein
MIAAIRTLTKVLSRFGLLHLPFDYVPVQFVHDVSGVPSDAGITAQQRTPDVWEPHIQIFRIAESPGARPQDRIVTSLAELE